MKPAKLLVVLSLLLAAFAAEGQETFQAAPGRTASLNPAQYSFADVYRLALAGPAVPGLAAAPAPETVRVAASAQAPAQPAVAQAREPQPWLLLLAGAAAAVWVARRRLGYAF